MECRIKGKLFVRVCWVGGERDVKCMISKISMWKIVAFSADKWPRPQPFWFWTLSCWKIKGFGYWDNALISSPETDPSERYRWYHGEFSPHYWVWKQYLLHFLLIRMAFYGNASDWHKQHAHNFCWERHHANVWGISWSCKEINLFCWQMKLGFWKSYRTPKKMTIGFTTKNSGISSTYSHTEASRRKIWNDKHHFASRT